ncbi:hypothetical protein [Mycobacterium bohemicum]|nr:hypothetical protein [Mycobacterium bohemicum]MCV6971965.1 hypothetical protein [Mycobacterium bohemicum]
MRAEEGDESVKDYAAEGAQTLGKIKDAQRSGGRLRGVAERFARLWRGEHGKPGS